MRSPLAAPVSEKIVDSLLKEVHSGRIMACLGEDLATPDLEWDPLQFSQIDPASPLEDPDDLLSLVELLEEDPLHPCLPDRVDNVIGEQYRKGHQVESSSFLSPGEFPKNVLRFEFIYHIVIIKIPNDLLQRISVNMYVCCKLHLCCFMFY